MGGEGLEEATTTGKEAGAKADRESRTRMLKKTRTSVLKLLHQFLLSSFSALYSSEATSLPYLEKILISSCTYMVQTEEEMKIVSPKGRPSKGFE